ncbi:hypothetical protein, conserved in T. vivax [Trypanosoma vivax Y486]|uniref:Uncharacterized protein n=1 Tax=Trypanosoma vivax (strain Y486) TaxID=1055687 RepID=F9WLQ7_TRYVY|nr:hypothetical protein, conserved in T. vivax [Trypanosoma vivax Y486]|eukprot:CCD18450.1 hypothetical protein, conserved in T. vivax [Trypanosoma vivax Y486]
MPAKSEAPVRISAFGVCAMHFARRMTQAAAALVLLSTTLLLSGAAVYGLLSMHSWAECVLQSHAMSFARHSPVSVADGSLLVKMLVALASAISVFFPFFVTSAATAAAFAFSASSFACLTTPTASRSAFRSAAPDLLTSKRAVAFLSRSTSFASASWFPALAATPIASSLNGGCPATSLCASTSAAFARASATCLLLASDPSAEMLSACATVATAACTCAASVSAVPLLSSATFTSCCTRPHKMPHSRTLSFAAACACPVASATSSATAASCPSAPILPTCRVPSTLTHAPKCFARSNSHCVSDA